MEGISDIKIEGMDENRPPSAEHKTYINLFFRLNHQAPDPWCEVFNTLMAKHPSKPSIDTGEGVYIETWVKSSGEISAHLEQLKAAVTSCTNQYIENIRRNTQVADSDGDSRIDINSPQGQLNRIISELNFDI